MAYFSKYIDTLKSLKGTVSGDIEDIIQQEEYDNRLLASLVNFKKEVEQLIAIVLNNSALENKVSLMTVPTPGWTDPEKQNNEEGEENPQP